MTSPLLDSFLRDWVLPRAAEIPPEVRTFCASLPTGTRLAGNPRVSTEAQVAGASLPEQREAFSRFAESHGLTVVWIQEDAGVTGRDITRRDGLLRLLAGVVEGLFDAVAVYDLTRLSRRTSEGAAVLDFLEDRGAKLVTRDTVYDLTREGDRAQVGMLLVFAEQEYRRSRSRTEFGRKRKRDSGGWVGGRPPYGYATPERRGDPPVIVPEEAELVRRILLELYPTRTDEETARLLNAGGLAFRGRPWTINRVYNLHRERSRGEGGYDRLATYAARQFDARGGLVRTVWEPILSDEEWLFLARLREERGRGSQPKGRHYILSGQGVARCGQCSSPVVGSRAAHTRADGSEYVNHVYRCSSWPACGPKRHYNVPLADQTVLDLLSQRVAELGEGFELIRSRGGEREARLQRELAGVRGKQRRLLDAVEKGLELPGLNERAAELADQADRLELLLDSEAQAVLSADADLRVIREVLESRELLGRDPDLARTAVRLLIRELLFGPGDELVITWYDGTLSRVKVPARRLRPGVLARLGVEGRRKAARRRRSTG